MRKRYLPVSFFEIITIIIASMVILLISILTITIFVTGVPYLGQALHSKEVLFSIKLSLYTASVSTVICTILAVPTAYALTKTRFPLCKIWQTLLELPLSLPYLVIGLGLLLIFSSKLGKELSRAGFQVVFSTKGIIVAHIFVNLPFVIRIVKMSFQEVDMRLELIARMLGATKAKCFWTITLPLAKNSIIGAVILAWSRALGEFGATLMLVGTTRMKTETLPASIYLNMATGDRGAAMASAVILLIISVAAHFLFHFIQIKPEKSRIKVV
ncbi:ABC transporter permease [Anaeromicropila populeti]|uniref:Molybdate transport system permease protein n=1 Tax=Anaeromicropila populeti TaxID=37658 RepID=A0A1I6JAW9_9FIRM|nr:ABC transporter permease [Anaeromicropila populeti]SFR76052.1 molybdate transport system permease protein [Anaeromicropila populeti]